MRWVVPNKYAKGIRVAARYMSAGLLSSSAEVVIVELLHPAEVKTAG